MRYYQVTEANLKGSWQLKGLWDHDGIAYDPRQFCEGQFLKFEPEIQLRTTLGELRKVQFPLTTSLRIQGNKLDYTFATFDLPIVTSRVALLLTQFEPSNLQFLPVEVPECNEDLFALNVPNNVDCIDYSLSSVQENATSNGDSKNDRKLFAVYNLILDPHKVSRFHIFRVRDWETALIVSECVVDAMVQLGATGAAFRQVTPVQKC